MPGPRRQIPAARSRRQIPPPACTSRVREAGFSGDLNGIELRADDIDWSFGSGPPVSGLAQDLALVVCGRKLPAGRLHGEQSSRFTAA